MGKRPDTLETTKLAIELLRRIPRRRKVSAPELQRQLEAAGYPRDLRTIQRLLDALSTSYPIERDDSSKPYGYSWRAGASGFALQSLSLQESLLLRLAEEHLRNLLPPNLMKAMTPVFEQARTDLDVGAKPSLEREWAKKVRVVEQVPPMLPPKIPKGVLEAVSEALYRNQRLEVDYVNADGRQHTSTVMPLGLAQQGVRLFLVCRFEGHDDERTLALHRMRSARVTTLGFRRPKEFDLQRFAEEGRFGFGQGKKVRLSFTIEKAYGRHLLETPLSDDQSVQEMGDLYLISATVIESDVLTWWLRGFGDAISRIDRNELT